MIKPSSQHIVLISVFKTVPLAIKVPHLRHRRRDPIPEGLRLTRIVESEADSRRRHRPARPPPLPGHDFWSRATNVLYRRRDRRADRWERAIRTFDSRLLPCSLKSSNKLSRLHAQRRLRPRKRAPHVPATPPLRPISAALRSCFENCWEYSSENTRFQIDRPKQLDA